MRANFRRGLCESEPEVHGIFSECADPDFPAFQMVRFKTFGQGSGANISEF